VVELDGSIHRKIEQKDYDKGREHELRTFGIKVLRFKNEEVINDIELVVSKISRKMPTRP